MGSLSGESNLDPTCPSVLRSLEARVIGSAALGSFSDNEKLVALVRGLTNTRIRLAEI